MQLATIRFQGHYRSRARRRGQNLLEFALVLTFLFLPLLLGMLQFGVYLSSSNAQWNLSREGARYAAVQDPAIAGIDETIKNHIRATVPPPLSASEIQSITITPEASKRKFRGPVEVKIVYDMSKKLFIPVGKSKDSPFNSVLNSQYTTRTSMMMEAGSG